jgi:hypothetical protein
MIKNQTAMATRNRLCRETHQQDVAFNSGEQVLYWQPSAGNSSTNSKNDDHSSGVMRLPTMDNPWEVLKRTIHTHGQALILSCAALIVITSNSGTARQADPLFHTLTDWFDSTRGAVICPPPRRTLTRSGTGRPAGRYRHTQLS